MLAVNAMLPGDKLMPLETGPGYRERAFANSEAAPLARWLYLAAFALFVLDAILSAWLLGRSPKAWRRVAAPAAVALAAAILIPSQSRAATLSPADDFALKAALETRLAYVLTGNAEADRVSQAGLVGLSKVLIARTAVEPGDPIGLDVERDELVFFPLIYWPVLSKVETLSDKALAKVDSYLKQGGLIVFDTKNDDVLPDAGGAGATRPVLGQLLGKLDLPPLRRVPEGHVLSKAFYLLHSFPGRWDNGDPWVEAQQLELDAPATKRSMRTDGVSSVIVTSNDLAAAWAVDDSDRPLYAVVPGGEDQREMCYRVGVNIVMYALTGNYKSDQVHVPAILERLGH